MQKPTRIKHIDRFSLNLFFILSNINIQKPLGLVKKILQWLALVPLASLLLVEPVQAQQVIPANDGTGTVTTPNGNQINITGGQLSRDNANLFHSFTQFGLNADQIANFLSTPGIQNILGRVVGGDASIINGSIQVTGSNANLFLMNPAGIIFGSNASLNVPGAFTVTTANGIGFGSNWFSAAGTNNYADLVGNPGILSFAMGQSGAIFNAGNLSVGKGQSLTLLAGTVANTGSVTAPEGNIIVSAVPGGKLVRLSQQGSPLSLEIQPLNASSSQAQSWNLPILSLPRLLTSGGAVNATKLTVNNDGKLALSGSGIPVENGDVVAGNVTAKTALVSANQNLTGVETQLQTTGDLSLLAGNTVKIRDSVASPFVAKAGGNLLIQGNQGIDILALNHPEPAFQSGGNSSLVSDGVVSGDAHFISGGSFSILNLSGQPGTFQSLYDPIITVAGDYTTKNYEGAALKVEAGGNITFSGEIRITSPDSQIAGNPAQGTDEFLLQNFPALILRSQSGNINVNGNIDTSTTSAAYGGGTGGPVVLAAPGNITTGNIDTSSTTSSGGQISINSSGGSLNVGNLTSTSSTISSYGGGVVSLDASANITTGVIRTGSDNAPNKGDVNITSRNGSVNINGSDSASNSIVGKSITINAPGTLSVLGMLNARSDGSDKAGNVTIGNTLAPSSIIVGTISSRNRGQVGGAGGDINITTTGLFNATGALSVSTGLPVSPTEANSFSVASESFSGNGGNININANGGITKASGIISNSRSSGIGGNITLTSSNGAIDLKNNSLNSSAVGYGGGVVTLDASGSITTGIIRTGSDDAPNKGDVNITSRNGSVNINGSDSVNNSIVGKSITINTPGTVSILGGLNARSDGSEKAGNVTIGNTLVPSSVTVGTIGTRNRGQAGGAGGDINITTTGLFNATGASSISAGQPVNPTEPNSFSVASQSFSGSGGDININASGGINTAAGIATSGPANGGKITLTSNNGSINTNQAFLDSSSSVGSDGIISVDGRNINIGNINSSGSAGGNVTLNSGSDIAFGSINTQGTSSSGGNVNITTNGIVRGTGVIPAGQGSSIPANTTIFTRGTTPGSIRIQHNGKSENFPFIVGNSTNNGTAGAIDAGASSRINPGTSFPVLPNGGNDTTTPSGITIASVNSPATLTINQRLSDIKQDQTLTFTYTDLSPSFSDVDGDNTSLQITSIAAGTLRKNGVIVVPGTPSAIISPGDSFEYTPPSRFFGDTSPFSISASDNASFSTQSIGFNVAPTLPPPEQTNQVEINQPSVFTPPIPIVNANLPPKFDPVVEAVDNKFASQFQKHLYSGQNNQPRERRSLSLYETRDVLRQIEKETAVKPAIIYINFVPSGASEKVIATQQDSDQLELLIVTAKGDPIRKRISNAQRKDVLNIANNLYGWLENPGNEEYLQPSQELYQLIIAPLREELNKKGINNLLFIADEGLRSLPFAALHDGKQFLVENYSVGFTPALSITDTRYVDIRNSEVLAMGASKFQQGEPLPAVPEELSIVAKDIWSGKFFLNQGFTLNNLRSIRSSRPFGIIHLATHGEFEKGALDNSFIQFWDNKLKLSQMRDLGLNNPTVELLVLSACRTALGDKDAELGFGGIAYNAGVKTVVASLWKVSDSGTLGLMTEFYKNLRTAPIKAEALRQAQLAMIKGKVMMDNGKLRTTVREVTLPPESRESTQEKNLSHPYYWAAFTMIGSPW